MSSHSVIAMPGLDGDGPKFAALICETLNIRLIRDCSVLQNDAFTICLNCLNLSERWLELRAVIMGYL